MSNCSTGEYHGIIGCDNKALIAQLNARCWAGYVKIEGIETLMTSDCPQGFCSDTRINLPNNSSYEALERSVCSNNRKGILCGSCQKDYHVYVNSVAYHCGRCNDTHSKYDLMILIISKYLPMTVMMCFIFFFDISLVDGPLNSFILFSQIFVNMQSYDEIEVPHNQKFAFYLKKISNFMYNIWNLNYFEYSWIKNLCAFTRSNSALPVLLEEYIPAFYVSFLCFLFYVVIPCIYYNCFARSQFQAIQSCALRMHRMCIRFRYRWSVKNSVIHSLTTFLVLSYARITLVTFKILTPAPLHDHAHSDKSKVLVWFDGTKQYFGHGHRQYASAALFILIFFVLIPPLLLLSYPLLPAMLTRLGLEDYWIVKKLIINPLSKYVPMFDAFQSCYKNEYRFFAGLLFVYRVLGLAVLAFAPTTALNLAGLQGFFLIALLIHCTCQPYKKRWHNFIEGFIFTMLSAINIISLYRLFQAETTNNETNKELWLQIVLMYCPLMYFLVYSFVKVFRYLRPRIVLIKNKLCGNDNINRLDIDDLHNSYDFPARMEDESENSSESSNHSVVSDDDDDNQQQNDDDDDVEMIHSVQWNDADYNCSTSNIASPYNKTYVTL